MEMLLYNRLNTAPVQRQFDKTISYLQQGDFRSADVRKMKSNGFYRARLDDTNRLLFKIGEYDGKKYLFILEVILNHDYDKSRFLRGATVKEEKLTPIYGINAVPNDDIMAITYLNPRSRHFTILDKCVTLSEAQSEILYHEPPMLLLGAAGSGKTVLALEKIRNTKGRILYVTLSPGLAQKASEVYHKDQAPFAEQEVLFCSLDQYLRQFCGVPNREASFEDFKQWFERIRSTVRIKDCHKIFEEIRGVLTGTASERGFFSLEEYQQLGVRQSVFANGDREEVHSVFSRYLAWLKTESLYDPNIFAFAAQKHIEPTYDMVVVDEVQDFTTMQLSAVLKSLKHPTQFLLCGDANQVVHPNFFSWTSVKRLLHQRDLSRDIIRLLPGNHRNDDNIIKLANKVLALKNVRFGSIDRESSNAIIDAKELTEGEEDAVLFFEHNEAVLSSLKRAFATSSHVAIIVLRDEDKAAAKKQFNTPMIFSVHEAKGLEFHYVLLYNFLSDSAEQFNCICEGVAPRDINGELQYKRPKDKEDRSLQAYQFYINSLYVAMTRAIGRLYIIERDRPHRLLSLLGVRHLKKKVSRHTPMPPSSLSDWQRVADDLEKFGRKEHAEAIRAKIGKASPVPWEVVTYRDYVDIRDKNLIEELEEKANISFNFRETKKLYNFLLFYPDFIGMLFLNRNSKNRLKQLWLEMPRFNKQLLMPFETDRPQRIEALINKYGPNYRNEIGLTPLMLAAMAGATNIIKYLLMAGADPNITDNWGRTAYALAIVRAHKNEVFLNQKLRGVAELVMPPFFNSKGESHNVSIPSGELSYYISHIIIALQLEFYYSKRNDAHVGLHIDDFCKMLPHLLPEEQATKWAKREFVSAYLAESDVHKNKRPFLMKLGKGYYTMFLDYAILINDEWVKLSDLFYFDKLQILANFTGIKAFITDCGNWALSLQAQINNKIEKTIMAEDEAATALLPDDSLRDWPA